MGAGEGVKMRAIASNVIGTAASLFLSAAICLLAAGCEIYQVRDEVNVYIVLPEEPPKPEPASRPIRDPHNPYGSKSK